MSLLTISLTVAGETPASVALLTLTNDATGVDVSGAAGVTLPKAFTLAGGAWTCTFTDTGLPLYGYTYQFTWNDGSTSPAEPGTKRGSANAAGYYADQTDLARAVTTANLSIWTGQDPTAAPDAATVQAALDYADNEIDRLFQMSQYTTSPHLSVTGVSAAVCKEAATWYAVDWLYRSRGDVRDDDSMGNHYAQRVREQTAKLMQYRGGVLQWDAARRWPVSTAPVACC